MTLAAPPRATPSRIVGVDVTRGLAILGMVAVHVFATFTDSGAPSAATLVAGGRSATAFAFVAGLSLAFLTGGAVPAVGRRRLAAAAGIAVRGVLIGLLGLTLAYLEVADVILPAYGLMFLLVIPLLWQAPGRLVVIALALALVGPVLVVSSVEFGLPQGDDVDDPTLTTLVQEPGTLLLLLLVTGSYPVVIYLVYLLAGLAVGRLDLARRRLAWGLLGGGIALTALAQLVAAVLLYPLGGMARLVGEVGDEEDGPTRQELRWEPDHEASWWYLALPSPHAHTTFDVANTLGSALAILGAALLLTRIPAVRRAVRPLADLGSMPLTIYSAHLVVLSTGVLEDHPGVLFVIIAVGAALFAYLWRRHIGQGPLERLLAAAARPAREAVLKRG